MKNYLLCVLNDEEYRYPQFAFFNSINEAYKNIKNFIEEDIKGSSRGENRKITYEINSNSDNHIIRINYSFGKDKFLVFELFEIEIVDKEYLCIHHHAYNGEGFTVEKVGTQEDCQRKMTDSATEIAKDFNVDVNDDSVFEVNEFDSCVDIDDEWQMWNIIQFHLRQKKRSTHKSKYNENVYRDLKEICSPIYNIPGKRNGEYFDECKFIAEVDNIDPNEIFKMLCEYHGVSPSLVEVLYESIYGKSKEKTTGFYKLDT